MWILGLKGIRYCHSPLVAAVAMFPIYNVKKYMRTSHCVILKGDVD